jgi:ribosome-associated protein
VSDDDLPSRSALSRERKAEETRLAQLARALVGLSNKQLAALALDEQLRDAIDEARRTSAHAALARQLRIVRRELRAGDSAEIAAAVERLLNPRGPAAVGPSAAQLWVARFVAEGNAAVEAFVGEHPHAERQRVGMLVRNLRKADAAKAPRAKKTLLAAVKAWLREAGERVDSPEPLVAERASTPAPPASPSGDETK